MVCGKCGAKVPDGINFCPKCGQRMGMSEKSYLSKSDKRSGKSGSSIHPDNSGKASFPGKGAAVISLGAGLLSILCCLCDIELCIPGIISCIVGLVAAIISVVISKNSKKKNGTSSVIRKAGVFLSVIGLILCIFCAILANSRWAEKQRAEMNENFQSAFSFFSSFF